ncbi:hypothetical protein ACFX1R_011052 [Malus domestica]
MNQLALPKPLQPKHLRVRLKRRRLDVRGFGSSPDDVTRQVLGQVLVQPVVVVLQILRGFAQTERVEPVVAHQGPVQPLRSLCARVPERAVSRESGFC